MNNRAGRRMPASRERARPGAPRPAAAHPASTHELVMGTLPGPWCLLRDTDLAANDVEFDILATADRRRVRRALLAAGCSPVRSWGRAPHRQYRFWDEALRRPVRLDIVDRLAYGHHRELRIAGADEIVRHAIPVDGWPRPARVDEQWMSLLHALLDRSGWRPIDAARLGDWVGGVGVVAAQLPRPVVERLDDAVRRADWPAVERQRGEVVRALSARDPMGTARRRLLRRFARSTTKLQRALLRPGRRIAVLGPDGAGKSSTIDELIARGVVDDRVYLGVAPAGATHRRVPGLTLALVSLRLLRGWMRATSLRRRGRSVALDRHPLEATIGPPTTRPTTRARRWILAHLLPGPDAAVVLMAPAEVLWQRKPEHALDDVRERRERYLRLADERGYVVVDTTAPMDDVVDAIRRIVFDAGAAA